MLPTRRHLLLRLRPLRANVCESSVWLRQFRGSLIAFELTLAVGGLKLDTPHKAGYNSRRSGQPRQGTSLVERLAFA